MTLPGLEYCKAEEVVSDDDRVTVKTMIDGGREKRPYCGSASCMGMRCVTLATYFTLGQTPQRFVWTLTGSFGSDVIAAIPLPKVADWYYPIPGLPGRLKLKPYGS